MEPENLRFGGGAAETAIHPLIALLLLISIVLLLVLPRAKGIGIFLLTYFMIPMGQVVVLGGFHFTALRILTFAGLGRMIASGKSSSEGEGRFPGGFNLIDQAVVLWSVLAVITFYLQYMELQALIRILGDCVDGLGGYLVVRFFITDREAVRRAIKSLAAICAIQGVCMINERISHFNVFGLLGGIDTAVTIRDWRVRAAGVMGCLYAGAFAGRKVPNAGLGGRCRRHGHGDHLECQHLHHGPRREHRGAGLLASPQADAPGPVGTGQYASEPPLGHESARLGLDRSH